MAILAVVSLLTRTLQEKFTNVSICSAGLLAGLQWATFSQNLHSAIDPSGASGSSEASVIPASTFVTKYSLNKSTSAGQGKERAREQQDREYQVPFAYHISGPALNIALKIKLDRNARTGAGFVSE